MVKSCSAYNCTQRYRKGNGISFFSFPSDSKLRSLWVLAMKRENFEPTNSTVLCSNHFLESDVVRQFGQIKLREGSIPSIFDFPDHLKKRTPKPRKIRKRLAEKEIQAESTSEEKKLKLDLPSTSSENYSEPVIINAKDCSEKPQVQKKIRRRHYFGDVKYSALKTAEAKMVWNIANRTIEKIRKENNKLRTKKHKLQSRVTKLKELIVHLKTSKNVSQNCYDIMQVKDKYELKAYKESLTNAN
ncbi:THAP domain-containing protein 6-like isoform X2 [Coccinella septempunctata]|uniref:THAP domain-containing protein 6-like isoform X2 n=1 Tax=Coccinella septempunctata TaxID=41139 RepID=UPI001D093014|nr:THAP domain-containing protein 6-like isoform X2 [Coccinella septempunctata]